MIIDKSELASKLGKLKSIISARSAIECLGCVLIKGNMLIANNLELAMAIPITAEMETACLLPIKAIEVIEKLPAGKVKITSNEKHIITIEAENIRNKIHGLDPKEYPDITLTPENEEAITMPGEILQSAINSIIYAANKDESGSRLSGVMMECKKGEMNIVATDGYRMAWAIGKYNKDIKMIIPKFTVQKLLQLEMNGNIEIKQGRKNVAFICEEYVLYSRIIEGAFIEYKKIMPQCKAHVTANRLKLIDAIKRACIYTDIRDRQPITVNISEDTAQIMVKASTGEYVENVSIENESEMSIKIGFNAKYALDCLKAYKDQNVKLGFKDSLSPMLVDDGQLRSLLLPVRLKKES